MKAILASGLGMTLGLLTATGHAQEAQWRAVAPRGPQPPAPTPTPAPPAAILAVPGPPAPTASGSVTATTMARWLADAPRPPAAAPVRPDAGLLQVVNLDVTPWVRARAQGPDEAEPLRHSPVQMPSSGPAPVPVQAMPATAYPGGYPVYLLPQHAFAGVPAAGRAPRLALTAEYLMWWVKGTTFPPLLSTSPPGANGFLNTGAAVLLGGDDLDQQLRHGGRFGTVLWLDDCASWGFDGRLFFTGRETSDFSITSDENPNLFRPFFALNTFPPFLPGEFSERVTRAGEAVGAFHARNRSFFWGAEANYRDNLFCRCGSRLDLLAGFRYLNLDEELQIVEDVLVLRRNPITNEPPNTRVLVTDRFATRNDFYGGQIGSVYEYRRNRWSLEMRSTVALGTTRQRLTIEGSQLVQTAPGQPVQSFVGGLLALDSNIGERSRNAFSVVPEVGLTVGYQLTDQLKAFAGYNYLYWSNVIRPADQIDRGIDVTRVPRFAPPGVPPLANEIRPAVLFRETDFWAQGLNFGMEYRW